MGDTRSLDSSSYGLIMGALGIVGKHTKTKDDPKCPPYSYAPAMDYNGMRHQRIKVRAQGLRNQDT